MEWTLVRRLKSFTNKLFKDFLEKIGSDGMTLKGEQFTDENGRVDLIFETKDQTKIILVELETSLNGKYDFALEQTKRYKNMWIHFPGQKTYSVIMYAKDITSEKLQQKLEDDCKGNIDIIPYYITEAQQEYDKEIEILSKNIGLLVETRGIRSVSAYGIASANRMLLAYKITKNDRLSNKDICNAIPTPKGKRKGKPLASNTVSTIFQ